MLLKTYLKLSERKQVVQFLVTFSHYFSFKNQWGNIDPNQFPFLKLAAKQQASLLGRGLRVPAPGPGSLSAVRPRGR